MNFETQTEVYKKASGTDKAIIVIFHFSKEEKKKVDGILREFDRVDDPDVLLIDARADNKPSGSLA